MDELKIIPLSAIPAQRFQCVLNDQNCTITIKKRGKYCYFSLVCNNVSIVENVICLCGNNLIPYENINFVGSIFFIDVLGNEVPDYEQFNGRFRLCYVPDRYEV